MAQLEIPNRSLFRQPEVCEIASIQPYVLRSWEAEFPDLGVAKAEGGRACLSPRRRRARAANQAAALRRGPDARGCPPQADGGAAAGRVSGSGAGEYRRALRQGRARAHPAREARPSRTVGDARRAPPGTRRRRATEIFSCEWTKRRSRSRRARRAAAAIVKKKR